MHFVKGLANLHYYVSNTFDICPNNAKKAKAEQATYDVDMTKTTQSLTTQLRDVARAFCVEVWSEALNVVGITIDSELRSADRVYYPLLFISLPVLLYLLLIRAPHPQCPSLP